jgi:hypothetical protein
LRSAISTGVNADAVLPASASRSRASQTRTAQDVRPATGFEEGIIAIVVGEFDLDRNKALKNRRQAPPEPRSLSPESVEADNFSHSSLQTDVAERRPVTARPRSNRIRIPAEEPESHRDPGDQRLLQQPAGPSLVDAPHVAFVIVAAEPVGLMRAQDGRGRR